MTAGKKIAVGCGVTLLLVALALGGGTWYVFNKANASFDAVEIQARAHAILPIAIPDHCKPKISFAPDGEFTTTVFFSEEEDQLVISITGMGDAPSDDAHLKITQDASMAGGGSSPNPTGDNEVEVLEKRDWPFVFRGQEIDARVTLESRREINMDSFYIPIALRDSHAILTIAAVQGAFTQQDVLNLLDTLPADFELAAAE